MLVIFFYFYTKINILSQLLTIYYFITDEKVQLASQMYELVDRYLRRLDAELFKFKIELEADNAGITEVLEKSVFLTCLPSN